jgi:hypothetical protein
LGFFFSGFLGLIDLSVFLLTPNVSIEGLQPRVRDFKKGKEVYGRVDVQGNHGHQGGPRNGKALVEARVNGRKILCVITGLCKKRIGMGPRLP